MSAARRVAETLADVHSKNILLDPVGTWISSSAIFKEDSCHLTGLPFFLTAVQPRVLYR